MTDIPESWSQPWHALQRNLAQAVADHTPDTRTLHDRRCVRRVSPCVAGSWLVRARGGAVPQLDGL